MTQLLVRAIGIAAIVFLLARLWRRGWRPLLNTDFDELYVGQGSLGLAIGDLMLLGLAVRAGPYPRLALIVFNFAAGVWRDRE